ncbi:hypothetical protein KOR42_01120 [Thalassoglobus neptunius]|uniref:Uncharacterized protein n=1 Tax=Thalassoglobus neptunius TaxID=1938619 RepID=A0A5C5X183_9PLAN|nr:hypothetical protein [Thalassoglobus neptunius]TWT56757.1 hypothetical protein KOR42_01120 [Thalassoglobus neptunius]
MDDPNLIDELQREVESKEAVILALTSQLETTAEQLERMRRTGPVGGQKESGFGPGVNAQIRDFLAEFDESSPLEHFERIEIGIEQILEILAGSNTSIAELRKLPKSELESTLSDDEETEEELDAEKSPEEAEEDFWAATKARLLQEAESQDDEEEMGVLFSGEKEDSSSESAAKNDGGNQAEAKANVVQPIAIPPEPEELPELPKPVTTITDAKKLEEAVTERDQFIFYLVARLRRAESYPFPPINWESVVSVPEDLKKSVMVLEKHLKDHLRQSELSVSLERAALTRERSKLCQVKSQLQDEIQKMVAISNAPTRSTPEERMNRLFDIPKDTGPKTLE